MQLRHPGRFSEIQREVRKTKEDLGGRSQEQIQVENKATWTEITVNTKCRGSELLQTFPKPK